LYSDLHVESVELDLRIALFGDPGAAEEEPGDNDEDSRYDTANDAIHVEVVHLVAVGLGGRLLVHEACEHG
ncbi:hypothetical protein B8W95_13155, partial [Staphylococcus pasteuri]